MSVELTKKVDELGHAIEEFKKANDERLKAIEKKGGSDPALDSKVDKANEAISKIKDEMDAMKTAMNRTASAMEKANDEKATKGDSKEYKEAFQRMLRKGFALPEAVIPAEIKNLSVDSNADGGFLVRPELSAKIVTKMFESSPIRQLAQVDTIGSDSLEIMQDLNEVSAGWVSERGSRSAGTTPQLNLARIFAHELFAEPVVTQKLLDDAQWDVEAWLAQKIADKFGRTEASAFVGGTGVGQPRGITSYPAGTSYGQIEQIGSGTSGVVTADGIISLVYGLKPKYVPNASFLMQRALVKAVRQLKDSQNRYLWEPSMQAGEPESLLGHPVYYAADLAAASANSLSIAFGDIRQGYQIVDRVGIRMLRDPYSTKGSVTFYATKRVGGDVVDFDAIKLQKLA